MITKTTQLRLVNKMIEADEVKLARLIRQAQELQAYLDRLYIRRGKLEADIRMEERDAAPMVKTQPAGVRLGGIEV